MLTIYLTKGLPASGKSTWAKKLLNAHPGSYKRVNKDDLRAMLDDSRFSSSNERFILCLRDHIIKEALRSGKHIIVDDTNLHHKHATRMLAIIKELKEEEDIACRLVINSLSEVAVNVCIERDLRRANSVGEKVIKKLYNQYIKEEGAVAIKEKDLNLPDCIIVDIDGTLAIRGERSPYDWNKVGLDDPKEEVIEILNRFQFTNYSHQFKGVKIILFSGRDSCCRDETKQWLIKYTEYDLLYMRAENDNRKDSIVKRELFEKHIEGKYNVLFVLDDRNQVVDMWRNELGLTCLQVQEGDF